MSAVLSDHAGIHPGHSKIWSVPSISGVKCLTFSSLAAERRPVGFFTCGQLVSCSPLTGQGSGFGPRSQTVSAPSLEHTSALTAHLCAQAAADGTRTDMCCVYLKAKTNTVLPHLNTHNGTPSTVLLPPAFT